MKYKLIYIDVQEIDTDTWRTENEEWMNVLRQHMTEELENKWGTERERLIGKKRGVGQEHQVISGTSAVAGISISNAFMNDYNDLKDWVWRRFHLRVPRFHKKLMHFTKNKSKIKFSTWLNSSSLIN